MSKKTELADTEDNGSPVATARRKFLKKAAYQAPSLIVMGTLGTISTDVAASAPNCDANPTDPRCPPHP